MKQRCNWCLSDPLYIEYHDQEWGVPCHDEQRLFEFLVLEGMQAGLSWITILRKRAAMQRAFLNFDPEVLARVSDQQLQQLLTNPEIIRNRLKIFSARNNAQAFLKLKEHNISFNDFLWQFTEGKSLKNHWSSPSQVPAKTTISDTMAKELKRHGFNFVGSTICYALMQAIGIVNDHMVDCYRHGEL